MGVRLRDRATLLVPQRAADPANPRRRRADWSLAPEAIPVRFHAEESPTSSGEEEGTGLSLWRGTLPPTARLEDETVVDLVAKTTQACRIVWHGDTYELNDRPRPRRMGNRVRFISVQMKRLDARTAANP